jgi:hypothetical protein
MPEGPGKPLGEDTLRRVYEESAPRDAHPSEDVLERLLGGALAPAEREAALEHVARCAECSAVLQHVSRCEGDCGREFHVQPIKRHAPRDWGLWGGLLAAASLVVAVLWLRPSPDGPPPSAVASPVPPRVVATLRDGAGELRLTADGHLEGLTLLDESIGPALAVVLRTGVLPLPAELAGLHGRDLVLMGESKEPVFRVLGPLGTMVRSAHPTLRWTAVPGASYVVTVLRDDLTLVEKSPSLEATDWTLRRALAAGETYVWQVAAQTGEGRLVAPAPPSREARFRVLDTVTAVALARDLDGAGGSLLVRGYLLARAGVIDEAEDAFAALSAANPSSAEAARLLETLRPPS